MKLSLHTEYLFFHLMTPSPVTGEQCPLFYPPTSLFFRWSQPFHFYFQDKDTGKIRRLNKERIEAHQVLPLLGNLGRWMWTDEDPKTVRANPDEEMVLVEYLDKTGIGRRDFLTQSRLSTKEAKGCKHSCKNTLGRWENMQKLSASSGHLTFERFISAGISICLTMRPCRFHSATARSTQTQRSVSERRYRHPVC